MIFCILDTLIKRKDRKDCPLHPQSSIHSIFKADQVEASLREFFFSPFFGEGHFLPSNEREIFSVPLSSLKESYLQIPSM